MSVPTLADLAITPIATVERLPDALRVETFDGRGRVIQLADISSSTVAMIVLSLCCKAKRVDCSPLALELCRLFAQRFYPD